MFKEPGQNGHRVPGKELVNSVKLMLEIPMPTPAPQKPVQRAEPQEQKASVEDKVREALDCIDSGHDSAVEWSMINRVYKDLMALKKPSPRAKNLMGMIEPVLEKYGYFEVPAGKTNGV